MIWACLLYFLVYLNTILRKLAPGNIIISILKTNSVFQLVFKIEKTPSIFVMYYLLAGKPRS